MADVQLTILSTTAMKLVFEALGPSFERESACGLAMTFAPSLQIETRLASGEPADVAIVTASGIAALAASGVIAPGTTAAIASSPIGLCVARGAPPPRIDSAAAFTSAMLAAKSIALSAPVGGGASGVHMAKVFAELGIADVMRAKSRYGTGGVGGLAGLAVRRGEAEIGIQQMSELLAVEGIDVVGPLPPELQRETLFSAGAVSQSRHLMLARTLIAFLMTPIARDIIKSKGLVPPLV
jgi:molybdate transport system substrate-binding protein